MLVLEITLLEYFKEVVHEQEHMQIDTTIYCEEKDRIYCNRTSILEGIPWLPHVPKGNCSVRDRFKKNNVITKTATF